MRLSRMLRTTDAPDGSMLPLRVILLWTVVAVAIVVGIVLYFRFERTLTPLVG